MNAPVVPGEAAVLSRLAQVQALPALPMVVNTLSRRIGDQTVSAGEIGRLLAHDQALTARVLRLANSAFYSPKEPVRTPDQAVVMLGFGTVRAIILKASIFSAYDVERARPYWLHALGTACAARTVARIVGLGRGDDAFVMGLLHDLGKLALDEFLPELYRPVRAAVARDGGLIRDAELRLLGCDHAAVGRFLCEHWSLPPAYRDAIAGHHDLSLASEPHRPFAACVHLADIIARGLMIGSGGDDAMPLIDPEALRLLNLREERFAELFAATEEDLGRAEVFFTIING
ncbi:MAG TPA: HDOD domain-containing protein [Planctomycetota bacterium]|jgi:HD-like signal output (HDOD) protein|nr:HDOD domain-containing protein [Planctomycetota bacterium]